MKKLFIQVYVSIAFLAIVLLSACLITLLMLEPGYDYKSLIMAEYQRIRPQLVDKNYQQALVFVADYKTLGNELAVSIRKPHDLPQALQEQLSQAQTNPVPLKSESIWHAYYPIAGKDWGVYIDNNVTATIAIIAVVILPIVLVLLSLALGLIWVIHRFAQPLLRLEQSAQRLGNGDIKSRVHVDTSSPIFSLANSFNQMAEKLDQSFQEQQTLVGSIPHELRTPLHRIRFALDLTRKVTDIDLLQQRIEKIDGYVSELEVTIQDILELSRLQSGRHPPECRTLNMFSLFQIIQQEYQATTQRRIVIDCEPELTVYANEALLLRALANLTCNACRFASAEIILRASAEGQGTSMAVIDDGPGIPEQYHQAIFTPFFRIDDSRNRATGGVGLGLALVRMIIQKHHGTVQVKTDYRQGAWMEMYLPSADPAFFWIPCPK